MFTGIVSAVGKIISTERKNNIMRARIGCDYDMTTVDLGASISCNGVCLTVVNCENSDNGNWFDVDISQETLAVTSLKNWDSNHEINLERAMKLGDEIGGHLVSGHVDGIATITQIEKNGENTIITFSAPSSLARFIAPKGSACLDGTSLTVNNVNGCDFDVNLIPHTVDVTNWKNASIGDEINLEIDMMARYVARLREFEA